MKPVISVLAACASALIFTAGCSKTEPPPAPTPAPQAQSEKDSQPTAPPPAMPPPDVPKGDASSGPKPGQANDHSSPAFKAGGKEVPK